MLIHDKPYFMHAIKVISLPYCWLYPFNHSPFKIQWSVLQYVVVRPGQSFRLLDEPHYPCVIKPCLWLAWYVRPKEFYVNPKVSIATSPTCIWKQLILPASGSALAIIKQYYHSDFYAQYRSLWFTPILRFDERRFSWEETFSEVSVYQADCYVHLVSIIRGMSCIVIPNLGSSASYPITTHSSVRCRIGSFMVQSIFL